MALLATADVADLKSCCVSSTSPYHIQYGSPHAGAHFGDQHYQATKRACPPWCCTVVLAVGVTDVRGAPSGERLYHPRSRERGLVGHGHQRSRCWLAASLVLVIMRRVVARSARARACRVAACAPTLASRIRAHVGVCTQGERARITVPSLHAAPPGAAGPGARPLNPRYYVIDPPYRASCRSRFLAVGSVSCSPYLR